MPALRRIAGLPGSRRRAEFALLGVALAWGLSFPAIKLAVSGTTPLAFLGLRSVVALLCLLPLLRSAPPDRGALTAGIGLGLLLAVSIYAQTAGLVYTTATRSAFITGLSVAIVPLLEPVLLRRLPDRWSWLGVGLALAGLWLFAHPSTGAVNRGDVLTLFCALGYALYVIAMERSARRHPERVLLWVQTATLVAVTVPGALIESGHVEMGWKLGAGLLTTGPILALALFLLTRYQKATTATRAAVIYTTEPVFAAGFAWAILGESMRHHEWWGAGLIVLGLLAAVRRRPGVPV